MEKAFIYVIKNTKNNKVYIGQTKVSIKIRWQEHLRHSKYGDQLINRAMRKYGKENFYIELLEECTINNVDQKEIDFIKLYNSTNKKLGYNISIGGNTPLFERPIYDKQKFIQMYKDGFSLDQISKDLKISRYILRLDLINNGFKIRSRYYYTTKCNKIPKEKILKLMNLGLSMRKASKILGVTYSTFRNACLYNNIEYNSSTSVRHPEMDENVC